jgi:hypothetical protein
MHSDSIPARDAGVRSRAIDIGEFAALLGDTSTDANWRRRPPLQCLLGRSGCRPLGTATQSTTADGGPPHGPPSGVDLALQ